MRRVKICVRSCFNSIGLQRRPTPMCIHFKDVLPHRKELRNLRPGITSHHPSPWRVEALYSRIVSHRDCFLQPQELDVLPRGQEIKSMTGTMVSLPIGIRRQVGSHCRNENNTIGHTLQTTRFHPQGRHGQWEHHDVTGCTLHEPYRHRITGTNLELWKARLWCYGSIEDSIRGRPHNHSEPTPGLDGRTRRRKTSPILSREKLYLQRWGTTTGHS